MDHRQSTRPAQRNKASLIVLIVLALLLMAAAVVLVIKIPDDAAWQLSLTSESSAKPADDDSGFACEGTESQQIYPFSSGVMKIKNNRISMLDIHGAEKYAVDIDFAVPFCVQNENYFLAADRDGHSYVMLGPTGELYRGSLAGKINGARIGPNGYLALISEQSDNNGVVSVFAPQTGSLLFYCSFSESGYVLSVSFPKSGDCFDVALVNTAAAAARPIIKRYDLNGKQLGQRIPDLTELYPVIAYDADQNPVLCGATGLAALSYDKSAIIWQRSFQQVMAAKTAANGLIVIASEKQDGKYSLYRLQSGGTGPAGLTIGDTVTNLELLGDLAAVGSGTRVIVADNRSDKIIFDQDMQDEVIRVGFADSNNLTIITRTRVQQIKIAN